MVNYWSHILLRHILVRKREYREVVHQLFIGFKKVYDSFRRGALYNFMIDFGMSLQLVLLIKCI
jgi:hypothetical protein